ncbi:hypothetical protein ACFVWR_13035 [Leifsonia sp. NPDC058292]|uniref:hypothetical protein n=1 Tax=Leifsonia sp. NPDC058292 TaxID=3346428 RepID=UPI0036D89A8B
MKRVDTRAVRESAAGLDGAASSIRSNGTAISDCGSATMAEAASAAASWWARELDWVVTTVHAAAGNARMAATSWEQFEHALAYSAGTLASPRTGAVAS